MAAYMDGEGETSALYAMVSLGTGRTKVPQSDADVQDKCHAPMGVSRSP